MYDSFCNAVETNSVKQCKATVRGCVSSHFSHVQLCGHDPGIEPTSLTSPALAGGFFTTSVTVLQ